MRALRAAWREYAGATSAVSRPARLFLTTTLLSWMGYGVNQVLFNLYLVEGGFQESFVGRAIALTASAWRSRRCRQAGSPAARPRAGALSSVPPSEFGRDDARWD
jgi:hypothetical protein